MNKLDERKILEAAYSHLSPLVVNESESPDFLCEAFGSKFGVEVTEFFVSESEARLQKLPGYGLSLLKGGDYRHKKDKASLKVEDITYHIQGDEKGIPLKAMRLEVPSAVEIIKRVADVIAKKEAKCNDYLAAISPVDLLILDSEKATPRHGIEQFLRAFLTSESATELIKSKFREIYFLAAKDDTSCDCLPLRANVFAAEICTIQHLFLKYFSEGTEGDFLTVLSSHLSSKFPSAEYSATEERFAFLLGSFACYFDNGTLTFEHIATEIERRPIKPDLDGEIDATFAEYVKLNRDEDFMMVLLSYPSKALSK